jgi:hypothetical protein
MTEEELSLERFIARYADRDEPLVTLTDEELFVLTAGVAREDRLVPLEVFDALDEDARLVAARVAHRCLVARGIVVPLERPAVDPETGLVELEVHGPTVAVLDLLAATWPLVVLTQQHGGRRSTQVHLNLADRAVLVQHVQDGFHRFRLRRPETAALQLAAALDPAGSAGHEPEEELVRGPADTPPASWGPLRERIEAADGAAQLLAIRSTDAQPRELALEFASLDDGLVMVTGDQPDADGEATQVVARRLSRSGVLGVAVHALDLAEALA